MRHGPAGTDHLSASRKPSPSDRRLHFLYQRS
jgi:hypothetical protein